MAHGQANAEIRTDGGAPTLSCIHEAPIVTHTLKGGGFDASEDGTGRGTPLVPVLAGTLKANNGGGGWSNSVDHAAAGYMVPVAVSLRGRDGGGTAELGGDIQNALRASQGGGDKPHVLAVVACEVADTLSVGAKQTTGFIGDIASVNMAVRRLTPVECERLQGFPDGYTNIPWRNKPDAPDGPRYKSLGNSMAVPVMRWIGTRIQSQLRSTT
jgi:DNA (cytosine-5)-methyltransferase 1